MSKYPIVGNTPYSDSLLDFTNDLITQPYDSDNISLEILHEEFNGGGKKKYTKKYTKKIDTFKKNELVIIAKNNNINLKTKEGKNKNKTQLYNSLNRKKLL